MKKLLILFTLAILACSMPVQLIAGTPTPTLTPTETSTPTQTPPPTAQPGSEQNPLILALAPSAHSSQDAGNTGKELAGQLEQLTGYHIVVVAPTSEVDLVDAFSKGNVHIAVLSPFAYVLARQDNLVTVGLASVHNKQKLYGVQFIANRDSEFKSFYDAAKDENSAEAKDALIQFNDKKPCWSDAVSPSGYVVPLGVLNQAKVQVRDGAFLEGQPNVVRAVYASDICDFGATYIDARTLPALEVSYPDVMDKVRIIWQLPAVIPYENVSFASSVPLDVRRILLRAFVDLMTTSEGKTRMQTLYGIDALEPAEDDMYTPFAKLVEASGLDLRQLILGP